MGNVLSIKGSITGYPDELAALMGGWTEAISYLFTALLHTMIVWVRHASLIRSVGDVTVAGVTAVLGRDTRLGEWMGVAMCTDCLDICLSLNHAFELPVCLQQISFIQGVRCLYTCFVVEDDCLSQTPLCTIGHFTNTLLSHTLFR